MMNLQQDIKLAIRATFEPEWKIMKEVHGKPVNIERNQNAEKLVSILSLLPESAIVPKNRLIVYSGIEKYGKTKLIRPAESAFFFLEELNLIDVLENGKSVRIHPLLREYIQKLEEESTENQVVSLKRESILNLRRAYYDNFPYLARAYVERNYDIDSLLDDIRTVLEWSKREDNDEQYKYEILNPIHSLYKILGQESHNLRLSDYNSFIHVLPSDIDKSLIFAQQIHIRSIVLGSNDIADKSREYLSTSNTPFLNIKWAKVGNKQALIRTLLDHTNSVNSVSISSDNTKFVSGSFDGNIKVWDLNKGKVLRTLEGHSDSVESVAISLDNTRVVSSSRDKTIRVWDLGTGKLLNILYSESYYNFCIQSIVITFDNKIVSSSNDCKIRVWDLGTGKLLNTLERIVRSDGTFAITSDNRIVSGYGNTIKVWDLETGELLKTTSITKNHNGNVYSVAISPDNTKIISRSFDKTIKVWDLETCRLLKTIYPGEHYTFNIQSVAISPDNTKIVSYLASVIKVWDMNTGKCLSEFESHKFVESIAITPDNMIVSGLRDGTIKVWDSSVENLLSTQEYIDRINGLVISPDNTKIVTYNSGIIRVWDLNTGKLLQLLGGDFINSVAIGPDSSNIILACMNPEIKVQDMDTGKVLKTLAGHTGSIESIAITSDNSKIVSGSGTKYSIKIHDFIHDCTIKVWDIDTGKVLKTLAGHTGSIESIAITSDNSKIVSGSGPGYKESTIRVWDLERGKLLKNLDHSASVNSVTISPDNSKIVSGSNDNIIKVWDLETGKLLKLLEGHTGFIECVAITCDNIVISGSTDHTIRLWNLNTGKCSWSSKFDSDISCVAVSKELMVIGERSGNLYLAALM